jgi:hypothetical protein
LCRNTDVIFKSGLKACIDLLVEIVGFVVFIYIIKQPVICLIYQRFSSDCPVKEGFVAGVGEQLELYCHGSTVGQATTYIK